ncbi:MAG: hypothetical protein KA205_03675 [Acidobacteria bacterium]|nr:hypothetical protein [Acidobacteriota bacterium]
MVTRMAMVLGLMAVLQGCGSSPTAPTLDPDPVPVSGPSAQQPVYVVLFTHIEDNTPAGEIGSGVGRSNYARMRQGLIDMATLARRYNVKWSLQPDWKFLLAAQAYEDAAMTASTGGKNVLRYLRDSFGTSIDPHSHENGGYNYTDVAYLLDQLGVGGSTVIGGHIWDPTLPQFQDWDRFRSSQSGSMYPSARWRGDILMGAGTPNHVNDPIVSGVWRPRDRFNFFTDDAGGNIVSVGAFKGDVDGITELNTLSKAGTIASTCMKTVSIHILPANLTSTSGLSSVEANYISPVAALGSQAVTTDFTSLVATWRTSYNAKGCVYQQR